jgi:conjugal transfer ATP-binding protein TraC
MDFCELDEFTLGTFDAYLECIPGFKGENIRTHTVLGSSAIHFLPFFQPAKGDRRAIATFQTRNASLYSIDPVDSRLANYNWLVSGTSGAGKSFFVNSLLAQSSSLSPNIFIVDIGGSYNKLTQFFDGQVMSLEPEQGFELSPFFLPRSNDPKEERLRRQHIFQIFLEMARVDGQLPPIEIRHLLHESLNELFERESLPEHPISALANRLSRNPSGEAHRLALLLEPWRKDGFFGQFLDNNKVTALENRILTFDLKGLTEFEDLSRVVQLIVCASIWARVRQAREQRFSWIVLDEVAFSLLKTQPEFVDELVSTLRKYFAGAIIVVQDLEKVTSNFAGSSILQNTQSKAILQQRGDPRNYSEALSLTLTDQWAIESLRREKGSYSEVFLIRDSEKTVIRHVPSRLEYWLGTTAPEDCFELRDSIRDLKDGFQKKILNFVELKKGGLH